MNNVLLPLSVGIPLLTAVVILLIGKFWKGIGTILAPICGLITLIFSIDLLSASTGTYWMGGWPPPFGIVLVVDSLTKVLMLAVNLIAFLALVYSVSYMEKYTAIAKYYALFMLMLAGLNGVVLTGDLFNLFVFLEIASIASYALVGFGVEHEELEAGFKYLILGSVASTAILVGIAIVYNLTGSVNMADSARFIINMGVNKSLIFAAALFMFGFSLKAGLVPFHAWLPDAHPSAPAPVSAMLSGVLIKAIGIYAMMRVVFSVFGGPQDLLNIILWLGVLSALVGGLMSLGQNDMKRMLAFSSVSQVGYIAMAIGLGTPLGIAAGLFHLFNHAAFKGLMFLNAGSIEHCAGTRNLRQMGGLMKKMPVTSLSTLVGSFSISGIPPFNGFWSKLLIIIALIQAKAFVPAAIAVIVSVITLIYYAKIIRFSIFGKLPDIYKKLHDAPFTMLFSLIVLSILCFVIGIFYPFFMNSLFNPAAAAILDQAKYISMIIGG
ncbi:NADH/ubiquinone/plastoquinone (complex I) [bacterium]|nr:MAG: NADH/ubiquinone/plastoquinone (complex I) [bacterium]